jgi:2-polyprenyl-3-methyl-5-hydroxy-6-metoxy-1,4-benzoquinol methylase
MSDPTQRFTNRVDHYVKYRPSYPRAVLDLLETECGLTSASVVADVGSGTGILSELFQNNGNRVFGIEPGSE